MCNHSLCQQVFLTCSSLMFGMTWGEVEAQDSSLAATHRQAGADVESVDWKDLRQVEKRVQEVYKRVQECIVRAGSGTGTIISEDGLVLTAYHVIDDLGDIVPVALSDGRRVNAEILGYDIGLDMALLKIVDDRKWPHIELGYSCLTSPGQWSLAIGYPAHAARGRPPLMRLGRVLAVAPWWVATDCLTEGGDSGGPLFDLQGRLVAFSPGGHAGSVARGQGYRSVDAYRQASARLLKGDRYWHPQRLTQQLGTSHGYLPAEGVPGAQIGLVIPGSSADKAGLKAGDVIVEYDDVQVTAHADVLTIGTMNGPRAGTRRIKVSRGNQEFTGNLSDTAVRLPAWKVLNQLFNGSDWLQAHPEVEIYSRNDREVQSLVQSAVASSRKSVAVIYEDGQRTRLGTIVSRDGVIVTTAEGLQSTAECRLEDERAYPAKVVARVSRYNLAVLKVDARDLTPAVWQEKETSVGSLVVSVQQGDSPISMGVVGTEARPQPQRLAVDNLRVSGSVPTQFPQLHAGDVVTHVSGVEVDSQDNFRKQLSNHSIGDPLALQVSREGRPTTVKLESLGFPDVFLHDAIIGSVHEGGPVISLDGKALGINVGRSRYISTCTLPAALVRQSLAEVLKSVQGADTQQ